MSKIKKLFIIMAACLCLPCLAFASEFDGRWYFEDRLLLEFMPPEGRGDTVEAQAFREKFLNNTYLTIDTEMYQMEMAVFGEHTEIDYFNLVEGGPGVMKIRPVSGYETTILRIGEDGRLEIIEESGYVMYLSRSREAEK